MKKVLIITYYWPPAGGPGVQRWLKFATYLREYDVQPIIYTPENPDYPLLDQGLLDEVPKDIRIVRKRIFEPYKLARFFSGNKTKKLSSGIISNKKQSSIEKLLLWVRGNCFIPDARKFWIKPSVNYLSKFIVTEKIDTIITTGPPHSVHLIGKKLKDKLNIKWIADFRDPWTTIGYHNKLKLRPYAAKKHIQLEYSVLNNADRVLVTSPTTKEEFAKKTNRPIAVITNGYDTYEIPKVNIDDKFTLSHIGSLLTGRNPLLLWEVLSEMIREEEGFSEDFELELTGAVSEDVANTIYEYGLKAYTKINTYIPHSDAILKQRSAQVLLLIEINSPVTRCIIPGKLFEYMYANRPIIAIGPQEWDVFNILKTTKTGFGFSYEQKKSLKEKLVSFYKQYKTGTLNITTENIAKYSRKSLTGELAKIIHNKL